MEMEDAVTSVNLVRKFGTVQVFENAASGASIPFPCLA
jgi:hypothetical protein